MTFYCTYLLHNYILVYTWILQELYFSIVNILVNYNYISLAPFVIHSSLIRAIEQSMCNELYLNSHLRIVSQVNGS